MECDICVLEAIKLGHGILLWPPAKMAVIYRYFAYRSWFYIYIVFIKAKIRTLYNKYIFHIKIYYYLERATLEAGAGGKGGGSGFQSLCLFCASVF